LDRTPLSARLELTSMNHHVSPLVAGLCFVLGGCAVSGNAPDDEVPASAGSAGSEAVSSFSGASVGGAASAQGGGDNVAGGTIDSA
jgi:hypothetical protein